MSLAVCVPAIAVYFPLYEHALQHLQSAGTACCRLSCSLMRPCVKCDVWLYLALILSSKVSLLPMVHHFHGMCHCAKAESEAKMPYSCAELCLISSIAACRRDSGPHSRRSSSPRGHSLCGVAHGAHPCACARQRCPCGRLLHTAAHVHCPQHSCPGRGKELILNVCNRLCFMVS